ncbi:unnamed protein product [Prorocentrum cordatum]|uniref:Uncharacterized protein n=1 Tax=Prorocentrum cordatum TaxID=2364126 RepID=A0ABN9UUN0_9DINO|nr:unnamed protein product [Polarella glacialis]
MPKEFLSALLKRRSDVDDAAETWESAPSQSNADASHLSGLKFDAPSAKEWLKQLEPTPEEDALAGALADGLAERAQEGPEAHVPRALTEADKERLQQLQDSLKALKLDISEQRDELSKERQEIDRRQAELADRERALEEERDNQERREAVRRDYPQPEWLDNLEGTINVGVVGNSGVGKSLLINKLRRVRPHADGWAPRRGQRDHGAAHRVLLPRAAEGAPLGRPGRGHAGGAQRPVRAEDGPAVLRQGGYRVRGSLHADGSGAAGGAGAPLGAVLHGPHEGGHRRVEQPGGQQCERGRDAEADQGGRAPEGGPEAGVPRVRPGPRELGHAVVA